VIKPLDFLAADGAPFNTQQVYNDLSKTLLLFTTSAEWCTACIKEQPKLQALYESYGDQGLEVLVTLFQDSDFEPATPELASRWREKYDLSYLVVADPQEPSVMSEYYDVNLTPMVMLVDTITMEIMYLTQGFDEDQVRALIESKLGTSPSE
jgi:thiol-disulfide isomerase/thioredoxin